MNRHLTEFQRSCEGALVAELLQVGRSLVNRELRGQSETFIKAAIAGANISVYIYEDEAQFHRNDQLAGLYERADFPSLNELQAAFVHGVLEEVNAS